MAFFANLERELDQVEFFRPADKHETMMINLRNIFQRMQPTRQDIQTLSGVIMSIAEGRKGPARGGVLDGAEAEMLRTLLAEHARAARRTSASPVRGLARLLRRNPTEAERTLWDALTKDRRFAGHGFKRQTPIGRAHHRPGVVSAAPRDRSRAGEESEAAGKARASAARGSRSAAIGWSWCRPLRSRPTWRGARPHHGGDWQDRLSAAYSVITHPLRMRSHRPSPRRRDPSPCLAMWRCLDADRGLRVPPSRGRHSEAPTAALEHLHLRGGPAAQEPHVARHREEAHAALGERGGALGVVAIGSRESFRPCVAAAMMRSISRVDVLRQRIERARRSTARSRDRTARGTARRCPALPRSRRYWRAPCASRSSRSVTVRSLASAR